MTYMAYPKPLKMKHGCKVSWKIYGDREAAEEASKAADHNARIDLALGYDFGFMVPGTITEMDDGTFSVCVP